MIKKMFPIILCTLLLTGCLGQTDAQAVVEEPYNPYEFTARDFLTEGGFEKVMEETWTHLPELFCDYKGIILNPGEEYTDILTVTGNTYDFENAELKCAVFSKSISAEDEYTNRLDMLYSIHYDDEGIDMETVFDVIYTDITRSESGVYNCVAQQAEEDLALYLDCKEFVEGNSYYIIDDETVKEPLDYGVLYCVGISENDTGNANYKSIYDFALSLEEKRITAYLLAYADISSSTFSTSETDTYAYSSLNYTLNFNPENIKKDLEACSGRYGLHVYRDELPVKEKTVKKEKWSIYTASYNTRVEDAKQAQSFLKQTVRNVYLLGSEYEIGFLIGHDDETEDVTVNIYYRPYVQNTEAQKE